MLYSREDFEGLRRAGRMAAATLDYIADYVAAGVSTFDLDRLVAEHTGNQGGICACLGYRGYPKNCCISINEVICHGIPDKGELLKEGDVLNIDITTIADGYYGDSSRMYWVGSPAPRARGLCGAAYDCMMAAIDVCRPGVPLSEVGRTIQGLAESRGFSVVRDFCGHGIGREFHQSPNVLHYYDSRYDRLKLKEGMVFTIEPMLNAGGWEASFDANGWTARAADGSLSAQFEHTLGITGDGAEIFTRSPAGFDKPPYGKG